MAFRAQGFSPVQSSSPNGVFIAAGTGAKSASNPDANDENSDRLEWDQALPPRQRIGIVPVVAGSDGSGVILNGASKPRIPYFTDFPWLPSVKIADVVTAARIRGS
jgi:hypothetical protein